MASNEIHFRVAAINLTQVIWAGVVFVLGMTAILQWRYDTLKRYEIIDKREQFVCPPVKVQKDRR